MPPPPRVQPNIPRGTLLRMGIGSVLVAVLLYLVAFWQPALPVVDPANLGLPEAPLVAAPQVDAALLAQAKDKQHEERLFLEPEPFSHLLAQSLNVSDEAARALGMPHDMVPIAELRADPDKWRGRWLYYRGKLEDLNGPRPGHPVAGYGIYEATLRLADGQAVLFAFSRPPEAGVHIGGWARAEGYLLKLRDVAFPRELTQAPLLVGKMLREDFEDWQPQLQLDPEQLSGVIDTRHTSDGIEPTADSWRTIDEDQSLPLWHLGAYARDRAPMSPAQWRQITPLNAPEAWDALKRDQVARGTPMRILGILVTRRSIAARPNPAGIQEWTEAWVQVPDGGGKTVPVWVPKTVQTPLGASLELHAYYFRRYAYEARSGDKRWTPLFVAADLDQFVFDVGSGMQQVSKIAFAAVVVLLGFTIVMVRRDKRRSQRFEDDLTERRRRRRGRLAAAGDPS